VSSKTAAAAAAEAAFRPPAAAPGIALAAPVVPVVAAPVIPVAVPVVKPVEAPVEITEASFGCIRDLAPVRDFYVGNLAGDLEATLAAANGAGGGAWPVGSVVQLVPGEAMVKREPGFSAATGDWEFFQLDVHAGATQIAMRGTGQVTDAFGGNCVSCHSQAEAKWDMVCEAGHGCEPTGMTPMMAKALQNTDPRCGRLVLPAAQLRALSDHAAMRVAAARSAGR